MKLVLITLVAVIVEHKKAGEVWRYAQRLTQKPVGVTPCQFDPLLSPRPLRHIGQFCDPIFNAQQSNAERQHNMGIGRWNRVELGLKHGLVVLVLMRSSVAGSSKNK